MNVLKLNVVWTTRSIAKNLFGSDNESEIKKAERWIINQSIDFETMDANNIFDEHNRKAKKKVTDFIIDIARKKRKILLFACIKKINTKLHVLFVNDGRNGRRWIFFDDSNIDSTKVKLLLETLINFEAKQVVLIPSGHLVKILREFIKIFNANEIGIFKYSIRIAMEVYSHGLSDISAYTNEPINKSFSDKINHLDILESEAIHIMREVVAEAENPAMLYSLGKDSSVMLHLALKAFYPSKPPFPLLHVDTRWKFQSMYDFRDYIIENSGLDLIVHINPDGVKKNINPIDHGSAIHTDIMKTQGLKQVLNDLKFDVTFGGARRDEEKSRAKERIFSFRSETHHWDPKNQRPELWNLYNCRKKLNESFRVFPLSNWTELDIWQYIYREKIPIIPLYFAAERPVVIRNNMLIMVDDDRLKIYPNEIIEIKKIRFRTLGCYPLTGAIESEAGDLTSVILELLQAKTSEREGRAIDTDSSSSMEKKKQEGYF